MCVQRISAVVMLVGGLILAACAFGCEGDSPGQGQGDPDATVLDQSFEDATQVEDRLVRDLPGGTDGGSPFGDLAEGCTAQEFFLKPESGSVPNVLLVVDHSNSMLDQERWPTMTSALRTLTSNLDDVVYFGLILFPPPNVSIYEECDTGELLVPMGSDTADEISRELNAQPLGGTPTALTLYLARQVLLNTGGDPPGYVVLATDGGPGCNASLDPYTCECLAPDACLSFPDNCLDDLRTLQAVDALYNAGIRTFVIGIPGTEPFGDLLDAMAIRGHTDVDHHHYAVTDGPQLQAALAEATGSVVPCIYELDQEPVNPSEVIVRIDGDLVDYDPGQTHGWDFDDTQTIHFYGAACEQLRDGQPHGISAEYVWCQGS